jgi:subfamily B ATP-binding cassette protein HlyB/CyaB
VAVAQLSRGDLLWLLGSLCQVARIPFDAALVSQAFPPPLSAVTLHEAARALGFRTGERRVAGAALPELTFPCIAFLREVPPAPGVPTQLHVVREGEADEPAEPEPLRPALLLRADASQLLFFRAGSEQPETLPLAEFDRSFEPNLILVAAPLTPAGARGEFGKHCFPPSQPDGYAKPSVGRGAGAGVAETTPAKFGFRWFLPELIRHKRIGRDVLLASFAIQLVGLATPVFTQVVIDKVVVHQTQSTLVVIAVALVMFMLFTSAMSWLRQYLVLHTGNRIDAVLGAQVFRHLLRLPLPFFENRTTGVLVARLHGVETIREFVSGAAVSLILDLPFLLIFLAVMFWYSWQLSLIAVTLLGAIGLASFLVAPVFRDKLNRQFLLGARNQSFLTEYVSGIATVKSLQMEPHLEQKYGGYLADYLAAGFTTRQVSNTYNVLANSLEQIMTLAILVVGALLVMQNDGFTVGMLVAFQMFASRMSQPLLRIVGLWQEFQQANIAVKRLADLMDVPAEPHALVPQRETGGAGRIDLRQVSFRYSNNHPFLYRNLSLTLKPGHLSVLMGPSGCGKSTLAKLLQGFYQPTDGQILLDGRDIRHLAANELRQSYGVVPQETVLFAGTIYDNLVMAHPHAGFEDVIKACKLAEIHDVIERLPQGYQTEIGEHGVGLSGGQRQRLAIARALLKRPKILIFDEAVSSLDQQTAEHFALTINQLKGKATMLFITHQIPKGLLVDEVFSFGARPATEQANQTVAAEVEKE